ncbi:MAG: TonB-dependent receptor, partial [Prevotellaceae bacterium]|nr:TonB-dependent receptor [Prevotellaceae bacterium]
MKFKIIGFFFLMFFCSGIFAQTKTITGRVKDTGNSPLPGVAVQVKNTSVGTVTGDLGEFSLNVNVNDTLVFVLVGMKEVRQYVGQKSVFEIVMVTDEAELEEVQVVAFGVQKKASVVSSITTVKPSELRVSAYNLTSSFAGKIPGMISYQTSGEPGADLAQFFVRGVTTFGYTPSPLILIDGFESSSYELARLQVDDIESFSILK